MMHKRKIIALNLFVLFIIIVGTLLYLTFQKQCHKRQLLTEMEYMPDIAFMDISDNKMYRVRENINDQIVCLVQVDPDCYFCHEQVIVSFLFLHPYNPLVF